MHLKKSIHDTGVTERERELFHGHMVFKFIMSYTLIICNIKGNVKELLMLHQKLTVNTLRNRQIERQTDR